MKKAAIYPYNREAEIIMSNLEYIKEYQIQGVLEDNVLENEQGDNSEELIETLILMNNIQGLDVQSYLRRIQWANERKIEILSSDFLIKELNKDTRIEYDLSVLRNSVNIESTNNRFKEITTPIITIMGLGENCDKFVAQIEVANNFVAQGYKPLLLSSNPLAAIMGWKVLPQFLFSEDISFNRKIGMFNQYLWLLEKQYKPDVFILGCSSGIMRFNENENNFYGELPLVISSSGKVDIGVLCLYNCKVNALYLSKLSEYCKYRLGTDVNHFCLAQQEYRSDPETKKIDYLFLKNGMINEDLPELIDGRYRLYQMSKQHMYQLTNNIIEELSSNLDAL